MFEFFQPKKRRTEEIWLYILTQIRRGSIKIHLFGTGVLLFLLFVIPVSSSGVWAVNSGQVAQSEQSNHHLTKVYDDPEPCSENTFGKKDIQIVKLQLDKPPNYKVVSVTAPSSYDPIPPITPIDGNTNFNDTAFNLGFPGDGSPDKPYSIDNKNITGTGFENLIEIKNTDVYFNITNCLLQNGRRGIYLENVSHGYIYNNTIFNNAYSGITLQVNCSNNNISTNLVNTTSYYNSQGIYLGLSDNNSLFFNTVRNGSSQGIRVSSSNNTVISNNYVYYNEGEGLAIAKSRNCIISDNSIYNNSHRAGLDIDDSRNCTFTDNIIYNNSYHGIYSTISENNSIMNNEIFNNNYNGIYMEQSKYCTLSNLTIYNNMFNGIYLYRDCGDIEMNNINSTGNGNSPIGKYDGIHISNSGNSTFSNIISSKNYGDGVYFYESGNSTFSEITSSENGETGLYISSCSNSVLSDIFSFNNDGTGIGLRDSSNCSIHNIKTINNGYSGLSASWSPDVYNNTFTNINSSFNSGSGINFNHVNNSIISNSNIYNNSKNGIELDDSKNITLVNNNVFNNGDPSTHQDGYGIYLHYFSNECNLTSNSVYSNYDNGIYISQVNYTVISHNVIYDNEGTGINIGSTAGNIISNNIVYHNRNYGLYGQYWTESVQLPEKNIIKNNDFIGNQYFWVSFDQADCDGQIYQFEDNFFDNYRFPDDDGDGIVDHPLRVGHKRTIGEGEDEIHEYNEDETPRTTPRNDDSAIHYLTSPIITSPTSWDPANPDEWPESVINDTVTIQWIKPLDTEAHAITYSLYYLQLGFGGWDEENWTEITSGLTTISYYWDTTNLIDGDYYLRINATCSHGLMSVYQDQGNFRIDNSPPMLDDAYASFSPFVLILTSIITVVIMKHYKRKV